MQLRVWAAALAALPAAQAWGEIGHRTVAYLAQRQFTDATEAMVATILQEEFAQGQDFSDAAVWPDVVKGTPAYSWSKNLHFMGGGSTTTQDCNVTLCAENACITRAIVNVTDILTRAKNPPDLEAEALKFLVHLVGDIHQPLHANNFRRGGNDIPVCFDNTTTNGGQLLRLHGVWDDYMPRKWNGMDFLRDNPPAEKNAAWNWAARLHENGSDEAFNATDECVQPSLGSQCPMVWAEESNALVCPKVLRGNETWVKTNDLFRSSYYNESAPIMEMRIQQAGNRLAAWLNQIAASRPAVASDEL